MPRRRHMGAPPEQPARVVLAHIDETSAAAGLPLGAQVMALDDTDLSWTSKAEVSQAIKAARARGPFTVTFDIGDLADPQQQRVSESGSGSHRPLCQRLLNGSWRRWDAPPNSS